MISPWTFLATTTPPASSVIFILNKISLAPLLSIVCLRDYALILVILEIHFLIALKLENFISPCWIQLGIGLNLPFNPLLVYFLDGIKIHYRSYLLYTITHGSPLLPLKRIESLLMWWWIYLTCNLCFYLLIFNLMYNLTFPDPCFKLMVQLLIFNPTQLFRFLFLDSFEVALN